MIVRYRGFWSVIVGDWAVPFDSLLAAEAMQTAVIDDVTGFLGYPYRPEEADDAV